MIRVKKICSSKDKLLGLEIKGHANFDESGKDLICAAVSSIVTGGFNALTKEEITEVILEEGYAKVILKNNAIESCLVLNVILVQLRTIEESYPQYIDIK